MKAATVWSAYRLARAEAEAATASIALFARRDTAAQREWTRLTLERAQRRRRLAQRCERRLDLLLDEIDTRRAEMQAERRKGETA